MRFHDDIFGCIGRTPTFRLPRLSEAAVGDRLDTIVVGVGSGGTGHSPGACLLAAENEAWRRPGSKILMIFSDSVRNYPGLGS